VRCRFGEFELDSAARQLSRRGSPIHLSRKAFDLLNVLLAHRPNVVSKEDLYRELWPDTHVTEANLMVLVGEVRRALADNAHSPQFIRTAHGVGYAFCGDAREMPDDASAAARARMWLVGDQRTYALSTGDNIIGRDPKCDVWLDDDSVSRRHACVRVNARDAGAMLADLHSTNGTFVGRRRVVSDNTLRDGDVIKFGSVTMEFRAVGEEPAPTKRIRRR
jgi:DNA-binding winged helix-turn-helix (wHTH) protein